MTETNQTLIHLHCDEEECQEKSVYYVFQANKEAVEKREEIQAEGFFVCENHKAAATEAMATEDETIGVYETLIDTLQEAIVSSQEETAELKEETEKADA